MPPEGRPADVVFDYATAQRVVDEIRRTIASVGDDGAAWHRAARHATPDWSGNLATTFADDEARWRSRLGDVLDSLHRMAAAVEHGVAAAVAEQHRISRLQAEWDAAAAREARRRGRGRLMALGLGLALVRGRPDALEELARTSLEVGSRWRVRSVLLLDALDAASVAELGDVPIDRAPARELASVGAQFVAAGEAVRSFAQALRSVDRVVDSSGVVAASEASVVRWLRVDRYDPTDPRFAEIIGRLPDGRRRSLEDFEQMSASERQRWVDSFADTSRDSRHRAISGVLAYLADSPAIRGDDRSAFGDTWWSVADAAVLVVIQDGWLRHHGLPPAIERSVGTRGPRSEAYEAAVAAWQDHVEATERANLSDDEALESWIRAEQAGVEFAEVEVAHAWAHDPTFVRPNAQEWGAITELVPGTHTFRLSILAGTERAFLLTIVDAVIEHIVDAMVRDPTAGMMFFPVGLLPTRFAEEFGDRITDVGGGWGDNWGLGAITSVVGGALGAGAALQRRGSEATTSAVEFGISEAAQGLAAGIEFLTPDSIEREIAEALVDPTLVPSEALRHGFDLVLGTDRAEEGLSFTYYFPMLIEAGWLPPLPDSWVDADGVRHRVAPPVQAGALRDG